MSKNAALLCLHDSLMLPHRIATVRVMDNQLPLFLDCEASSLRDVSYPIDVGWSTPDGTVQSYLVRPEWNWSDWDANAEALHGLSREEITRRGLPADHIARLLNTALKGTVAYSDNPAFDRYWIERLYEASSIKMEFEIRRFGSLFPDTPPEKLAAKSQIARYSVPGRQHRAANDVKFLIELYRQLSTKP